MSVDITDLRALFLALPHVAEGVTHGTVSFHVGKKFMGRLRDDDTVFALRLDFDQRDMLLEIEPEVFFTTDHFRGYPYVLIRLLETDPARLAPLVEQCWRHIASKAAIKARDAAK